MKFSSKGVACLLFVGGILVAGCGYGEVSPNTYQYAQALYGLTNKRAEAKLDPVSAQIESARAAGELPDREAEWLQAIVADARRGDWQAANAAARRMMEDQITE